MQAANKAVFLDRDGTIIEDLGYVSSPDQVKFIPGSIAVIKTLNQAGYKVVVITNQSGVARGLFPEGMVHSVDKKINKELLSGGAYVDHFYYCPHHPEHGHYPYRTECECRKPHDGLIRKAAKDLNIDLSASFMIGDKVTDIEAGQKAGVKTIFVLTGHGEKEKNTFKKAPDHISKDLKDAIDHIK
ncbi:MAG: D-glycero-beta-D-manno-heptose 1,7-bisphosphate 7-phosphatase [Candidatus Margulisiibacteriota bacterium]